MLELLGRAGTFNVPLLIDWLYISCPRSASDAIISLPPIVVTLSTTQTLGWFWTWDSTKYPPASLIVPPLTLPAPIAGWGCNLTWLLLKPNSSTV